MNPFTNRSYREEVERICANAKPDYPCAYYDKDGDCIEALIKQEPYYAERIDDLVTVYCGEKNDEIVGCLIKGVKKIFKKDPRTRIILRAGRVRLAEFLIVGILTQKGGNLHTYQRLRESLADLADIETELQCC